MGLPPPAPPRPCTAVRKSPVPSAMPPVAVFVREVILVHCTRGEGGLRRNVLQVYDKGGDLLAEHDEIHPDPIWPANYVRQQVAEGKWAVPVDAVAGGV